jgi:hypothetical protein
MFILGLLATGIIDLSIFTSRVGEFETRGSSSFGRFVSPLLLAGKQLDNAPLQVLLVGSGPGTAKDIYDAFNGGGQYANWFKLFYEYGIIGTFIFYGFLGSCLRRSRCPGLVILASIFGFLFLQMSLTLTIALCTLNGSEPRRRRIDEESRHGPSFVAGSAAV